MRIIVRYEAIDGCRQTRTFYTLQGAQRYAAERVGTAPEIGPFYAVSPDGIGTVAVNGVPLTALFPAVAPAPRERPRSAITVYADGSDDYCGEDDLTERAIEDANDAWAGIAFGGE